MVGGGGFSFELEAKKMRSAMVQARSDPEWECEEQIYLEIF